MMHFSSSLVLQFAAAAAAAQFHKRQAADTFQLFAYGENIGGLPLVSTGRYIYVGDLKTLNNTQAAPIVFTDSGSEWLASPNTTALNGETPTWSSLKFAVPSAESTSHDVVLASSNSTEDVVSTGFGFYGTVAFLFPSDGSFQSSWSAIPSEVDGVWTLEWNQTDASTGAIPLTIKSTPPSNIAQE